MRRIIVLSLSLFLFAGTILLADERIGTYTEALHKREVQAYYNKQGSLVLRFDVSNLDNEESSIVIIGEENITKFYNALYTCQTKYKEWRKVAIENRITDYGKWIETDFPEMILMWDFPDDGSTPKLGKAVTAARFEIADNGVAGIAIAIGGEAYTFNKTGHRLWVITFFSDDEIQTLMHLANVGIIKQALNKKTIIDDLFK